MDLILNAVQTFYANILLWKYTPWRIFAIKWTLVNKVLSQNLLFKPNVPTAPIRKFKKGLWITNRLKFAKKPVHLTISTKKNLSIDELFKTQKNEFWIPTRTKYFGSDSINTWSEIRELASKGTKATNLLEYFQEKLKPVNK